MRSSIGGLKVTERTALALLLGCFVTLASLYNLASPVLEGPDEMWHFAYVKHLADGGAGPSELLSAGRYSRSALGAACECV